MNEKTRSLLEQLRSTVLFCNVGCPVAASAVATVNNWKQAIKLLTSRESKYAWGEAQNRLTEKLHYKHPERYHRVWNTKVEEIRKKIKELVTPQARELMKTHKLIDTFPNYVVGDFVSACMEFEYSDIVPPQFYAETAKWYLDGHLPCGWEGAFPEGRLIVY